MSALPDIHVMQRTTRSSSSNNAKYLVRKCKTMQYLPAVVFCQNVSNMDTLVGELNYDTNCFNSFRSALLEYYHKSLEVNYNPDNPRTYI